MIKKKCLFNFGSIYIKPTKIDSSSWLPHLGIFKILAKSSFWIPSVDSSPYDVWDSFDFVQKFPITSKLQFYIFRRNFSVYQYIVRLGFPYFKPQLDITLKFHHFQSLQLRLSGDWFERAIKNIFRYLTFLMLFTGWPQRHCDV